MSAVMRLLVGVFALCAAAAAHAQPIADPLAPAREGMVACYSPEGRTCRGIYTYTFDADGSVTVAASASLQEAPPLIMRMRSIARMRDGMICGLQQASDIEAATFELNGAPVPPEETEALRAYMLAALSSRFGEACMTHTQTGDTISVSSTLDGRPLPNANTMIWVRPSDGYVLRGP